MGWGPSTGLSEATLQAAAPARGELSSDGNRYAEDGGDALGVHVLDFAEPDRAPPPFGQAPEGGFEEGRFGSLASASFGPRRDRGRPGSRDAAVAGRGLVHGSEQKGTEAALVAAGLAEAAPGPQGRCEAVADGLHRIFGVACSCLGEAPGRLAVAAVQLAEGFGIPTGSSPDQVRLNS